MLELGIFQHRIVESCPPLKHCSPVELTARQSTGPMCARNVYTGSTSNEVALKHKQHYLSEVTNIKSSIFKYQFSYHELVSSKGKSQMCLL